jgi:sigma-B regulation protein RsbU (phosphoserine phosphatase)
MFQMRSHGGLYLTIWYGVYEPAARSLDYCSAGPPSELLGRPARGGHRAAPAQRPIGSRQTARFRAGRRRGAAGSSLYVFSDGVFEVETRAGGLWTLERPGRGASSSARPGVPETQALLDAVRALRSSRRSRTTFTLLVAASPERF